MYMHMIPEPQYVQKRDGEFFIKYNTEIIMQEEMSDNCFEFVKLLKQEVKSLLGYLLPIKKVMYEKKADS